MKLRTQCTNERSLSEFLPLIAPSSFVTVTLLGYSTMRPRSSSMHEEILRSLYYNHHKKARSYSHSGFLAIALISKSSHREGILERDFAGQVYLKPAYACTLWNSQFPQAQTLNTNHFLAHPRSIFPSTRVISTPTLTAQPFISSSFSSYSSLQMSCSSSYLFIPHCTFLILASVLIRNLSRAMFKWFKG